VRDTAKSGRSTLVLGISGGVDSLVAGKLCQLAADRMKTHKPEARFIAVRLPYGEQVDEDAAQAALHSLTRPHHDRRYQAERGRASCRGRG